MSFSIFDIIILSLVSFSLFFGIYKGSINIIINFISFIASIIVAILAYPYIKPFFINYITNELFVATISGIISYVLSLVLFTFISSKIIGLCNSVSGGFFDRALGLILGGIRGWIFAVIIFTVVAIFSSGSYVEAENAGELITRIDEEKYPVWLADSKTTPYLQDFLNKIYQILPEDWFKSLKMPKPNKEEGTEDIIDAINRKKNGVKSFVEKPMDPDLQEEMEILIPQNDE
jgi:membrane protein required for colicin V production